MAHNDFQASDGRSAVTSCKSDSNVHPMNHYARRHFRHDLHPAKEIF